jgi:hypothetical protein
MWPTATKGELGKRICANDAYDIGAPGGERGRPMLELVLHVRCTQPDLIMFWRLPLECQGEQGRMLRFQPRTFLCLEAIDGHTVRGFGHRTSIVVAPGMPAAGRRSG